MQVVVLRLGHRPERDKRITTHVGLVARAFGAEEMILNGKDPGVLDSLKDVVQRWGGDFRVRECLAWKEAVRSFQQEKGKVVHLTMYGSPLSDTMGEIRCHEKVMVVVGAEKVPPEIYQMADWNVAVGNQPHSEVAALAVFLDRLMEGKELQREFPGQLKILPTPRGKRLVEVYPEEEERAPQG
jgi:tRNA (cytidine56-2'-O)-methyltransferase